MFVNKLVANRMHQPTNEICFVKSFDVHVVKMFVCVCDVAFQLMCGMRCSVCICECVWLKYYVFQFDHLVRIQNDFFFNFRVPRHYIVVS